MEIKEIIEPRQKQAIAREIPEALPEWFGIPQAREQYIAQSAGQPFFAALQEERPIGFCCLMSIGRDTAEPAVMGVRREFDEANRFSLSLGFREFEVFPKLWDEGKPSQVYVMALE